MFPETITAELSQTVIQQAASLSAEERQVLFLQYVEKAQQIWMRQGEDGYVMIAPESANDVEAFSALLPVWPHQALTSLWIPEGSEESQPVSVSVASFLDTWLPGLRKNSVGVVIFPTDDDSGILISPDELIESLQEGDVRRD